MTFNEAGNVASNLTSMLSPRHPRAGLLIFGWT